MTPDALTTVDRDHLTSAVANRLEQAGYSRDAAVVTAGHLILAEAEGYHSHGLRLLPAYLTEVADGKVSPTRSVELSSDQGSILVFDAHDSPGHPALADVLECCVDRASTHGVALAWVSRLRHTGRLAHYVTQATDRGLSAILTVTSALDRGSALVAPPGSGQRVLGSNPLAIGVSEGPDLRVVYDGSTAAVPFYELLRRSESGEPLDGPHVTDGLGQPSDDPAVFFDGGAILPAGGPRGFGLSVALALFAQLSCAPTAGGGTNAFVLVVAPQSSCSLARTVAELRAAGAHIPGSRGSERRDSPRIHTYVSTMGALRKVGIEVPCVS